MNRDEIEKRARLYAEKLRVVFNDQRYIKVIGRFVAAGFLIHNKVPPYRGRVTIDEVLWVGEVEPRVLELLPALLLRRPKFIECPKGLPEKIKEFLDGLRKGDTTQEFYGIPARDYVPWLSRLGRKSAPPSLLKSFRFQREDVERLNSLKIKTGLNETEVIRRALRVFQAQ